LAAAKLERLVLSEFWDACISYAAAYTGVRELEFNSCDVNKPLGDRVDVGLVFGAMISVLMTELALGLN